MKNLCSFLFLLLALSCYSQENLISENTLNKYKKNIEKRLYKKYHIKDTSFKYFLTFSFNLKIKTSKNNFNTQYLDENLTPFKKNGRLDYFGCICNPMLQYIGDVDNYSINMYKVENLVDELNKYLYNNRIDYLIHIVSTKSNLFFIKMNKEYFAIINNFDSIKVLTLEEFVRDYWELLY